jgi:hypothetical protein
MRILLAALALAVPAAASADVTQPVQAATSAMAPQLGAAPGFHLRMYERYCDKLREGPEAYALFVKRMSTVTGYTFTDFAPREAGDAVKHACRDANGVVASREQRGG